MSYSAAYLPEWRLPARCPKARPLAGLGLAVAALALPGCTSLASDPPALASVQPLPQQWVLAQPGGVDVPLDRYWVMLDDPLVDELVARARVDNLDWRRR